MKKNKNTTLSERFQIPIENRRRQNYCNVWTKTLQDSSMNGSNRRFTIMLQSDVTINCYYFWRYQGGNQKLYFKWKIMNWPKEKGQKDKQWFTKRCKQKLKIKQHETNKNRKDVNQLQTERLYIARCHLTLILGYALWSLLKTLLWLEYRTAIKCFVAFL